ncbi:FAD/NAD(P)-binding domain-containing protein [Rhizodiscina lignyota]|uniref:FAD/NAD(P)-binding domain-containing protein n=1 Tax=Rhizodiscina lignyota TaxID=1504668 RepID=A0A9P4IRT2_9PEZI|nr:FAD/NAD(P)-binding domain-containing protein [Rhizodiscina lignyota]
MILIVGAGISGITLARHLLNHNVQFRIFDQSLAERPQGFGLTIREATIPKLLELVGIDEIHFRKAVAVDRNHGSYSSFLTNLVTGEHYGAGAYSSGYSKDFRSNRERLRKMIQGDVKVEFGFKLVNFEMHRTGVTAEFANGIKVEGTLLVAADGVHSFIRRTVLPKAIPHDWPAVFFNGSYRMSLQDFERTLQPSMGDSTVQIGLGDNLLAGIMLYDVDRKSGIVELSWGYSRRKRGENDALFAPYAGRHDKTIAPPQLWQELADLPHPLVEPFRSVFVIPDINTNSVIHHQLVSLLILREDLSEVLEKHKVVFAGDSVHDWTNHAGTSANTAIIDAITLGEIIVEGGNVESYYERRHPTWQKAYDHNAEDFEALHRPQEEWDRLFRVQRMAQQEQNVRERL